MLVLEAAKLAQSGASKEEILTRLNYLIPRVAHISVVDNLTNIHRSGRTSWLKKQLGQAFQVKPIILMQDGETLSGGTLRGREQVIEKLSYVGSHACKNALTDYIFIWHARYPEGANQILEAMNQHNINGKKIRIIDAGPIIAGYMGEKTLGLMYYGDFESEWLC